MCVNMEVTVKAGLFTRFNLTEVSPYLFILCAQRRILKIVKTRVFLWLIEKFLLLTSLITLPSLLKIQAKYDLKSKQ